MAALNLVQLYLNVFTKTLVSVNGSPTSIPSLFYGDMPTFAIYPVVPAGNNASQGYAPFDMNGYTMNLTMADAPNAQTPPTPFASFDGLAWVKPPTGFYYFTGTVDMTQAAVGTFIGNAQGKQAYINLDVFDSNLKRTTLLQTTFQLNASIDTVAVQPGGNPIQYATLAQIRQLFVPKLGAPGEYFILQSEDATKKIQVYLGDDGALKTPAIT